MPKVTVRIQKYDVNVTEVPYEFITLEEFEVEDVESVKGNEHAILFHRLCEERGYNYRFWSCDNEDDKMIYLVVVRGEMEQKIEQEQREKEREIDLAFWNRVLAEEES